MSHIKGKSDFPHIRKISSSQSATTSIDGSSTNLTVQDKPWRKQKKEKREKLRRKFVHLDQH